MAGVTAPAPGTVGIAAAGLDAPTIEQRYAAAEARLEAARARRVRRTPVVLVALVGLLVLACGLVAAYDLRRLQTPRGTALAWTEAAVFGECTGYGRLSVAAAGRLPDPRGEAQRCADLRRATAGARAEQASLAIRSGAAVRRGRSAEVPVTVVRRSGTRDAVLHLVRQDHGWAVVRDEAACAAAACA